LSLELREILEKKRLRVGVDLYWGYSHVFYERCW